MAWRFDEMSLRGQGLVCLVLAALLTTAGWRTVVDPVRLRIEGNRARLASLEMDLAATRTVAARLPQASRDVAAVEDRLRDLERRGPGVVSLKTLHRMAADAGLAITSFQPEPPVRHGGLAEQPVALGLEGSYRALAGFFDRLATPDLLLVVNALDVRARSAVTDRQGIEATCHLMTIALDPRPATVPGVATLGEVAAFVPTYDAGRGRDPFLPSNGPTPSLEPGTPRRAPGLAGLEVADVILRGVARKGADSLAILEGPDGRSHVGRIGARLRDALVVHIAGDAVVLARDSGAGGVGEHVRKLLRAEVVDR